MDKFKALQRALVDHQKSKPGLRGPHTGLDQATCDAIVINALKAIGVKSPVIPGRTGNA